MNLSHLLRRHAFALILSSACAALALSPLSAADNPDQNLPALPLTATIGKGAPGEHGGPFTVTLKNTGTAALTVTATVIQSVASHNRPKTIDLPAHEIAAGGTWTIDDLAVEDRVVVSAPGHAKLEVKVAPPAG